MFSVDGLELEDGRLPSDPNAGPNQELAARMGIVMGTSHHEPMARNQEEYTTWGTGPWNYEENEEFLTDFWKYGAERAKGKETLFTVGMRGDGDVPLHGANVKLLESKSSGRMQLTKQRSLQSSESFYQMCMAMRPRYHRCGQFTRRLWGTMPME
jgi:hypothetical protein